MVRVTFFGVCPPLELNHDDNANDDDNDVIARTKDFEKNAYHKGRTAETH